MKEKTQLKIVSKQGAQITNSDEAKPIKIPSHLKLSSDAKKIFRNLVKRIDGEIKIEEFHSDAIGMIATEIETWVWANSEIQRKNEMHPGQGYIQLYESGATNISTEMVVRNTALKNFAMMAKKFGLTTKDFKELGESSNPAQLTLFTQLLQNAQ